MNDTVLQFSQYTIGHAWTSDYGDPQVPEDFDFIYPISPLHNIPTDRVLPPTILFTADRESIFTLFRGLKLKVYRLSPVRRRRPSSPFAFLQTCCDAATPTGQESSSLIDQARDQGRPWVWEVD